MALDVYLTSACNLRCKYCFKLDREDAPQIPLADITEILKAAFEQNNRYVSFSGGEPFLYKQIFEVLDLAHDLGYWINILTHGGLLDLARIQRLKKYWRLRVRVSLDGPDRTTNDRLRGEGTFETTMSKIDLLLANAVNVGIGVTVSEHNVNSLEEILKLCIEKGISFVRCVPVARVKKGKAAQVTAALHEQLLETLIGFSIKYHDYIDLPQLEAAQVPASLDVLTTRRCMAGKQFFGVTADKKLVPCALITDHPDTPSVIYEGLQSFQQLGEQMDAYFAAIKNRLGGICSTCEFREVCVGGCPAEKISFERRLEDEQPVCTKMILERIRGRFQPSDIDRLIRSWISQLQTSLEPNTTHACMRQAPYWSLQFKGGGRWNDTNLRFN